jgi:hypothetical protein
MPLESVKRYFIGLDILRNQETNRGKMGWQVCPESVADLVQV